MSRDSRLVLPLDVRDQTLPIPRWQQSRMLALDYTEGDEESTMTWLAEQDDVLLLRAVGSTIEFVIFPIGGTSPTLRSRLVGQEVVQPIRKGEQLFVLFLTSGRVEIVPFDRSGDSFQ